ncbi:hypothetical protein CMI47_18625 [Candidatus Pacearchaeota archaeon]|nr:hypothetical protein [Candidatus Pacearchaeota archaeon]|tara:strand:- start:15720 stop:15938 length:219 start_codon:yes stop_codon:yes gene_type:complete
MRFSLTRARRRLAVYFDNSRQRYFRRRVERLTRSGEIPTSADQVTTAYFPREVIEAGQRHMRESYLRQEELR